MQLTQKFKSQTDSVDRIIGWIDNTISKFEDFIDSFSLAGSDIYAAVEPTSFISEFGGVHLDYLFLDYDLMGKKGFDYIPDLLEKIDIQRIYIVTAYSSPVLEDRCRDAADKFLLPIDVLPKECLPFSDQPEAVQNFLSELDSDAYGKQRELLSTNIFDNEDVIPTFDAFLSLDVTRRIEVLERARETYRSLIDEKVAGGAVWLLLDVRTGEIIDESDDQKSIPNGDSLDEICEGLGRVVLPFCVGSTLDSIDTTCSATGEIRNYSTLVISYESDRSGKAHLADTAQASDLISIVGGEEGHEDDEVVHYDGGNGYSLFAYEYFLERGWINPIKFPMWREQGPYRLFGKEIVLNNCLVSDSVGDSVVGNISGFAVMNWLTFPIALRCQVTCDCGVLYPPERVVRLCNRRKALLGRNLKIEIDQGIWEEVDSGRTKLMPPRIP